MLLSRLKHQRMQGWPTAYLLKIIIIKTIMHFTFQILVIVSNLGFICLFFMAIKVIA